MTIDGDYYAKSVRTENIDDFPLEAMTIQGNTQSKISIELPPLELEEEVKETENQEEYLDTSLHLFGKDNEQDLSLMY